MVVAGRSEEVGASQKLENISELEASSLVAVRRSVASWRVINRGFTVVE